jgi:hypothetical protein
VNSLQNLIKSGDELSGFSESAIVFNVFSMVKLGIRKYFLQCCGSASGSASNKNPDPYPVPHRSDKLDAEPNPDPHQFADDKPKCMEYRPILTLFQGFEPLFRSWDLDQDPHQGKKSNPDPQQIIVRIRAARLPKKMGGGGE